MTRGYRVCVWIETASGVALYEPAPVDCEDLLEAGFALRDMTGEAIQRAEEYESQVDAT